MCFSAGSHQLCSSPQCDGFTRLFLYNSDVIASFSSSFWIFDVTAYCSRKYYCCAKLTERLYQYKQEQQKLSAGRRAANADREPRSARDTASAGRGHMIPPHSVNSTVTTAVLTRDQSHVPWPLGAGWLKTI